MTKPWPARLAAFFLWALAAMSASFWFTQVSGTPRHVKSAMTLQPDIPIVQTADLARVFGPPGTAATSLAAAPNLLADAAARLRLLGVVANRAQAGVALISLDGQPPRPYRVGSALEGGWKLQKVSTRSATLTLADSGDASVTIELAALTSSLAGAGKQATAPMQTPATAAVATGGPATATVDSPVPAGNDNTTTRN